MVFWQPVNWCSHQSLSVCVVLSYSRSMIFKYGVLHREILLRNLLAELFLLIYHIIQIMEIPVKKNLSISQWNCQLMASIWLWLEASFLETGLVPFQYKETTLLDEMVTSLHCFYVGFHILDFEYLTWLVGLCWSITLVVKCKTAVTPVHLLWSYLHWATDI